MFSKFISNKLNIVLIFLCLFLLASLVHFYPVWHKGYAYSMDFLNLVKAKNLHLVGEYSIKNSQDVILSSVLLDSQGKMAATGNKLTSLIYAKIFDISGFKPNLPTNIGIILYSLTTLLLFALTWRLFNLRLALILGIVFIFLPHVASYSTRAGDYGFALFFFSFAILLYFWNFNSQSFKKKNYLILALSGSFFALAFLCRYAFLISFVPFVVYDFFKNKSFKRILIFIVPFLFLASLVVVPDFIDGYPNNYLGRYFGQEAETFGWNGHCFPDPYTYYFERQEHVEKVSPTARGDVGSCLVDYGHTIGFKNNLLLYWDSIEFYVKKFLRLITFGGPLIIAFLMIGLFWLRKKNKQLFNLLLLWLFVWLFVILILRTSNRNHFLEIIFPLTLFISLGIDKLFKWVDDTFNISQKRKILIIILLSISILGHLMIADKWVFHERYNTSHLERDTGIAQLINKASLNENDVIATGLHSGSIMAFNYYTDKSLVKFNSETIERLLKKGKLEAAFNSFGVTVILGYDKDLSKRIIQATGVENIISLP